MFSRGVRIATLLALTCLVYFVVAQHAAIKGESIPIDVTSLSTQEIEEQLQQCSILESLSAHEASTKSSNPSFLQQSFALLFPFSSPAVNAMMGTLYISGPPNFLLALCPTDIDPSSLNVMVAFAVGGLLGDTLFHLLPEIFLGEVPEGEVRAVFVEPNKNLLLGVAIMVGFLTFVAMDKGLRIATGGEGHTHDHGSHKAVEEKNKATSSALAGKGNTDGELRKRGKGADKKDSTVEKEDSPAKSSVKLSAYLNIIADFTHNITDGLALSSSFYASPTIGATTTLAVFCHEIPHEVGDFALLIQGGMSKKVAMGLQFVTALGAVLGTVIGIAVQEFGGNSASLAAEAVRGVGNTGLAGTSLTWGDLLLPFTAGTFLYVGTVGVIPEMLETGPDRWKELRVMGLQFAAMAAGAGIMLGISWS
ncbi:Hypothetical protein R9X50_00527800 [Acrodontium crateriforme]|uniref:Uncharacterized protein n=1 Tax=Acrodontium crateriforme TaxID=150365 RepID=A0AAQ3R903_9PEZI|nr:Hypothetical protein R9X50_00527800 [Acrodontium crateriforme]